MADATKSDDQLAYVQNSATGTGAGDTLNARVGDLNVSVSGFGSATIALQRCLDGTNWRTIESYTSDTEKIATATRPGEKWRLNCTSYSSGTIVMRLEQ